MSFWRSPQRTPEGACSRRPGWPSPPPLGLGGDIGALNIAGRDQSEAGDTVYSEPDAAIKMADAGEASMKRIINKLKGSVKSGGVYAVGPIYAQVLINLASKLGLIRDHRHVAHITVSPSLATYKQLKSLYGIRSTAHAAEIVPFLVKKQGSRL